MTLLHLTLNLRVKYTNLGPLKKGFEETHALAIETGIMPGKVRFVDCVDRSFVRDDSAIQPYAWKGAKHTTQ